MTVQMPPQVPLSALARQHCSFFLRSDRLADLLVLGEHKRGVLVPFCVVFNEDLAGLFVAVFGDEETRRFGNEPVGIWLVSYSGTFVTLREKG